MRGWWGIWALVWGGAGCCSTAPPPPPAPSMPPISVELPPTRPTIPELDGKGLPQLAPRAVAGPQGKTFRRLAEGDCLLLAAANAAGASLLDDENQTPFTSRRCKATPAPLRQMLRYYTALELRNRAAADALERYYQLADAEARTDVLRKAFPVVDPLLARAKEARMRNVRYPLDPADLERQRSELESQLEQAELGSRLLNLDLKRRLGLPYEPADERLWPSGDFRIDPTPTNPDEAATAAVADRPELRGLRELRDKLTVEMLPELRELLHAGSPLLGANPTARGLSFSLVLQHIVHHKQVDAGALAELEVRRKQLSDLITQRERLIKDEARAAALTLNSQLVRATLARDRLQSWETRLAEAVKKREANQPGAELLEPQVRMEWLKAKAELIAEVAACHQARVRVRAAMGWLAWEAVGAAMPSTHP